MVENPRILQKVLPKGKKKKNKYSKIDVQRTIDATDWRELEEDRRG